MKPSFVIGLIVTVLSLFFILSSPYIVYETEQILVLRLGKKQREINVPGMYFKIPLVDNVIRYERRFLPLELAPAEVLLADQKRVVVDTITRYRISNPTQFFERFGARSPEIVASERLSDIINSSMRQVIARRTLPALLSSERTQIMQEILSIVRNETERLGIDVLDVRIRRADIPVQSSEEAFQKMRSAREVEVNTFRAAGRREETEILARTNREKVRILSEAERDAEKIRGEGQAEAIRILAEAYNQDKAFFEFTRSLDAYRVALGKGGTTMVLSPDLPFFRFLKEGKPAKAQ